LQIARTAEIAGRMGDLATKKKLEAKLQARLHQIFFAKGVGGRGASVAVVVRERHLHRVKKFGRGPEETV